MANQEREFDDVFKKKLEKYEAKPTELAWGKLNAKLPKKKNNNRYLMFQIAASISLLLLVGYFIWFDNNSDMPLQTGPVELKKPDTSTILTSPEDKTANNSINEHQAVSAISEKDTELKGKTISEHTVDHAPKTIKQPEEVIQEIVDVKSAEDLITMEIIIPELVIHDQLTRDEKVNSDIPIALPYTITIISNGISESTEKEGIIEGIEQKVDKIGGILNKVDQGLADLQDAKNNLFASIITKKEYTKQLNR